jgi:tetratricopeptide (TPR) repeat protein
MASRLEMLKEMVAKSPADAFLRYGLATEYANSGDLQQAAIEFALLVQANPNYAAAYYHGGRTLEKLGKLDEARAVYEKGIEVTTETGDAHTRSELQAALDILG